MEKAWDLEKVTEEILETVRSNYEILGIEHKEDTYEAVRQGIIATIDLLSPDLLAKASKNVS